jgi:hypothetical protein
VKRPNTTLVVYQWKTVLTLGLLESVPEVLSLSLRTMGVANGYILQMGKVRAIDTKGLVQR